MDLNTLMTELFVWLKQTYSASTTLNTTRSWCMLGFDQEINHENIKEYFDRTDLNETYVKEYLNKDPQTKRPYAYIQAEIDQIYSFQKSFVARHKTRMDMYRDDTSQKKYHTWNSLAIGYGRLLAEKKIADQRGAKTV